MSCSNQSSVLTPPLSPGTTPRALPQEEMRERAAPTALSSSNPVWRRCAALALRTWRWPGPVTWGTIGSGRLWNIQLNSFRLQHCWPLYTNNRTYKVVSAQTLLDWVCYSSCRSSKWAVALTQHTRKTQCHDEEGHFTIWQPIFSSN